MPLQAPLLKKISVTGSLPTDPTSLNKLATHKAILEAHGITDLAALGSLSFNATIVPQPGLVRAAFVRPAVTVSGSLSQANTSISAQALIHPPAKAQPGPHVLSAKGLLSHAAIKTGLSTLPVSNAAKLAGIAVVPRELANFTTAEVQIQGARRLSTGSSPSAWPNGGVLTGKALKVTGEALVNTQGADVPAALRSVAASSVVLPLNTAYWVANTINFANDTTIVIQANIRYLVIIANAVTVGTNVVLTYEDAPMVNPPTVPAKAPAPASWPVTPSSFSTGSVGYDGGTGTQPMQIGAPPDAPEVELWTLALNCLPTVNLKGQKGYPGVRGGDGADGGRGGDGSESVANLVNCISGPGHGGPGGKGGRGGTGGVGGNGGTGGRWSLYTTADVITSLPGFLIDVSGGEAGEGGQPGAPGHGGPGGNRGGIHGYCANLNWNSRTNGAAGPSGDPGSLGGLGAPGTTAGQYATAFVAISANDFLSKLTDPAITAINPPLATVGATIAISGMRFTPTDVVKVGGVPTTMTYVADTMLECVVPNTTGGLSKVQVIRSGGTQPSNFGTLWIAPAIISTVPSSPAHRLIPGTLVHISGTGFSPQTTVRVNGTDIAPVIYTSSQSIDFVMKRPDSVPYDPTHAAGEPALLSVASSGPILGSNFLPIIIATYQMAVIGDSIAWGEGLQDQEKYYSLVASHVMATHSTMSVYTTMKAHTGAVLGLHNIAIEPTYDGDIPVSHPTIYQQAQALAATPNAATIDLILVSATANDVGFSHFLDPTATHPQILARVEQFCHLDMRDFLIWLAGAFPAAKIIVTGYYAGVSMDSDPTYLVDVVGVMYGIENNQGLLPDALAASLALSAVGQPLIVGNATYFATQANLAIAHAVQDSNAALGNVRSFFADPGFGPQNAALASDAWVFGLNKSLNILHPTDSPASANRRADQCQIAYPNDISSRTFCELASTGHPNVTGSQHYAAAIIALL